MDHVCRWLQILTLRMDWWTGGGEGGAREIERNRKREREKEEGRERKRGRKI